MPISFKDDLSVEEVRRLLAYDAETGKLFWRETVNSRALKGDEAGHLHARWGYIVITIRSKKYKAHRLAWVIAYGVWPSAELDHDNGEKADNKLKNLREASTSQNRCNSRLMRNNTSGRKGVCWDNQKQQWLATIQINHKPKYLGHFRSFARACVARERAEKLYHGEFARAA